MSNEQEPSSTEQPSSRKKMWVFLGTIAVLVAAFGIANPDKFTGYLEKAGLKMPQIGQQASTPQPAEEGQPAASDPQTSDETAPKVAEDGTKSVETDPIVNEAMQAAGIMPTIDILRLEQDGSLLVAGNAAPNAMVELVLDDGSVIGSIAAGAEGDFVILPDSPLKPGDYVLLLRASSDQEDPITSTQTSVITVPEAGGEVLAMITEEGKASRIVAKPETLVKDSPAEEEEIEVASLPEDAAAGTKTENQEAPDAGSQSSEIAVESQEAEQTSTPGSDLSDTATAAQGESVTQEDDPLAAKAPEPDQPATETKEVEIVKPAEVTEAVEAGTTQPESESSTSVPATEPAVAAEASESSGAGQEAQIASSQASAEPSTQKNERPAAGETPEVETVVETPTVETATETVVQTPAADTTAETVAEALETEVAEQASISAEDNQADTQEVQAGQPESGTSEPTEVAALDQSETKPDPTTATPTARPKDEQQVLPREQQITPPQVIVEAVEVEGDQVFVAGAVPRGVPVRVYIDNKFIGLTRGTADNRFVVSNTFQLAEGEHAVRADVIDENTGSVLSRAEVPLIHEVPAELLPEPQVADAAIDGGQQAVASSDNNVSVPEPRPQPERPPVATTQAEQPESVEVAAADSEIKNEPASSSGQSEGESVVTPESPELPASTESETQTELASAVETQTTPQETVAGQISETAPAQESDIAKASDTASQATELANSQQQPVAESVAEATSEKVTETQQQAPPTEVAQQEKPSEEVAVVTQPAAESGAEQVESQTTQQSPAAEEAVSDIPQPSGVSDSGEAATGEDDIAQPEIARAGDEAPQASELAESQQELAEKLAARATSEDVTETQQQQAPSTEVSDQAKPSEEVAVVTPPASESSTEPVENQTAQQSPAADEVVTDIPAASKTEPAETAVASAEQPKPGNPVATENTAPVAKATPRIIRTGKAVIIKRGDNLWRISRKTYGRGIRYTTIYKANQDQIADPDLIYIGQIFKIPEQADEEG